MTLGSKRTKCDVLFCFVFKTSLESIPQLCGLEYICMYFSSPPKILLQTSSASHRVGNTKFSELPILVSQCTMPTGSCGADPLGSACSGSHGGAAASPPPWFPAGCCPGHLGGLQRAALAGPPVSAPALTGEQPSHLL